MCEGGQVWGHARRRGYATAEIWPKSDFDVAGVQKIEVRGEVSRAVSRAVEVLLGFYLHEHTSLAFKRL